jgi:hypothetical protein
MEEVKGYKAFNKDATNRYGKPFEEGMTYRVDGDITFGNTGNGYHMCTSLCDVFRYVDAVEDDVLVARVTGRGKFQKMDDEYYGYYDMYSFEEITIDEFMTREEVIEVMLNSSAYQVIKFLVTFKLNEKEKIRFFSKFRSDDNVMKNLLYYQYDCKSVFENSDNVDQVRLVMKYGQNNSKRRERK